MSATIRVVHAKVSGKAAGGDPTRVYGTHWDANHTVTGLENIDNTSDANKPVSTATQAALDLKQNLDATLTALAGVTTAADKVIYATGPDAFATTDLTSTARSLLDDTSTSAMRTTLGVAIGTDVQAFDSDLTAVAGLSTTGIIARTGTGTATTRTVTAPAAGISVSNGDGVSGNPTLALANDLSALEGLSSTGIARRTGTDTWSVGTLVTNAELATAAAYTLKGNATGSSATAQDFTIAGLTHKASPTGSDKIIISDAAASEALKYATLSEAISGVTAGVSSIAGNTGAFTLGTGLTNSVNDIRLSAATTNLTDCSTGSWTPFDASGAGLTFTTSAAYTKIGNMIFAYAQLAYPVTANGSAALIGGFPFSFTASSYGRQVSLSYANGAVGFLLATNGGTTVAPASATGSVLTNAQMSGITFIFNACYPAT